MPFTVTNKSKNLSKHESEVISVFLCLEQQLIVINEKKCLPKTHVHTHTHCTDDLVL